MISLFSLSSYSPQFNSHVGSPSLLQKSQKSSVTLHSILLSLSPSLCEVVWQLSRCKRGSSNDLICKTQGCHAACHLIEQDVPLRWTHHQPPECPVISSRAEAASLIRWSTLIRPHFCYTRIYRFHKILQNLLHTIPGGESAFHIRYSN